MGNKNKNPGSSRREFLKAAGKLTVYTPPAMMVLANPSLVAIAESGGTTNVPVPTRLPDTTTGGLPQSSLCDLQNGNAHVEC